jgi:hypothetical protein
MHELKLQEMKMAELEPTYILEMDGLILQSKLQMETNNQLFRRLLRTMNCSIVVSGITTAMLGPTLRVPESKGWPELDRMPQGQYDYSTSSGSDLIEQ